MLHVLLPSRCIRVFSSSHDDFRLPHTLRGRNAQKLSPKRETRRVLGCRDPDVVAAVVLDVEMAVEGLRESDLGQPAFEVGLLVAHLVGGVDADAAHDGDAERDTDLRPQPEAAVDAEPGQAVRRPEVAREHQARQLERDEHVRAVPVVSVVLELFHHFLGRVLAVGSEEPVEDREHDEQQQRADPPPHRSRRRPSELVEGPHEPCGEEQRGRGINPISHR